MKAMFVALAAGALVAFGAVTSVAKAADDPCPGGATATVTLSDGSTQVVCIKLVVERDTASLVIETPTDDALAAEIASALDRPSFESEFDPTNVASIQATAKEFGIDLGFGGASQLNDALSSVLGGHTSVADTLKGAFGRMTGGLGFGGATRDSLMGMLGNLGEDPGQGFVDKRGWKSEAPAGMVKVGAPGYYEGGLFWTKGNDGSNVGLSVSNEDGPLGIALTDDGSVVTGEVTKISFEPTVVTGGGNGDTPKSDPPKSDPPKTDPPKTDPPKTDPPKTDGGTPDPEPTPEGGDEASNGNDGVTPSDGGTAVAMPVNPDDGGGNGIEVDPWTGQPQFTEEYILKQKGAVDPAPDAEEQATIVVTGHLGILWNAGGGYTDTVRDGPDNGIGGPGELREGAHLGGSDPRVTDPTPDGP